MKRLSFLLTVLVIVTSTVTSQGFDTTCTSSESSSTYISHLARNSITLGPNYSFTSNGGTLTIGIQNPVVTGSISYTTKVNPESRTLNTTSYLVGTTKGEFNVDPMGGATYSIPLELLPGVNGLSPSLSLVYSSNSGPGIVGYGWQLTGLSVISRGPNNFYYDGQSRGIELDNSDRFYLDGQRLVNTNSTYGAQDALYQTENDIFTRITTMGGSLWSNRWFTAETKSGLKCEYGNVSGSRQLINGNRVKWYISKVADLCGNIMSIGYLNDNNCVYPGEIKYGPNTITFFYKEKYEKNASFLKGTKIEQWLLLDKITVKYNTTTVKTYEFKYNYETNNYNGYSLLNEIIEYGIGTQRYNSTAITYLMPANANFSQTSYNTTHAYVTYKSKLCTGDFNGDGKSDFFCLPDASKGATWTGYRVYYGDGNDNFSTYYSGTTPSINLTQLKDISSLDLNADGRDDILYEIGITSSSFYCMISNGSSFTLPQLIGTQSTSPSNGFIGKYLRWVLSMENDNEISGEDFNGDGVNDIFMHNSNGDWVIKSFGDGLGGKTSTLNQLGSGNQNAFKGTMESGDFDGDGISEIWTFYNNYLYIHRFNGNGFGAALYYVSLPYAVTLGDFNADGKVDLFLYGSISGGTVYDMSNWQIWLSTGTGFEAYSIPRKKTNIKDDYIRQGDFNGDGATDLMVTSKNMSWTGTYFYISKNNGKEFYTHSLPSYPVTSHNYYVADYNGDGITDFICTDGQSPWWNGYQVYKTTGNTSILAEKIGNGLGELIKINYTKISQATSSIYQKENNAVFPVMDYQGPLHVVNSVEFDNGLGSMNVKNYSYEGAKMHLQGKGILCFTKRKIIDVTMGIENQTVSSYNPTYYYPQLLQEITKRSGVTDTISKVTSTWTQKVLDPAKKRIMPYVERTVELNKLTGHSITTLIENYDNYGNASLVTKTFSGGHTEISTSNYENIVSSSLWLLGRPVSTVIQYIGNDTTFSRSINRSFSASNNNLTSETLYPGTALTLLHGYRYNDNGTLSRDSLMAGGIWRTNILKYQSINGIRLEKVTDPLQHAKEYSYDPNNGRLLTEKDYLENMIYYQYDELGRQVSCSTSFGNTVTTYNWESPTSITRYRIDKMDYDGLVTKSYYDELGRIIKTDLKGFDGNFISTTKEYNTKGQVYRISEPGSTTAWNVNTYNNYGQLTDINRPSGRNSHWTYSGATITETVGGQDHSKTFSSEGYILSSEDNGGTIVYSYLPNGKLRSITAPGGITTKMKYDYADNQVRLDDPSAGKIMYAYNAFGELTSQTSERLNQNPTTLTYYNDGRPYQKNTPEGISTFQYNAKKQLRRIKLSAGINRIFRYDSKGRIVSLSDSIGNLIDSTVYLYDDKGRLSRLIHPSGIEEIRHYNDYGYQDNIKVGPTTLWTINSMNPRLQVTGATYGSNLNLTNEFDDFGYSKVVKVQSGSNILQDFEYNFNPVTGNLNWRKDRLAGRNNMQENFDYDNLDRLRHVYKGTSLTLNMSYDNNKGGITRKTDVGKFNYNASLIKPYAINSIDSCSIIENTMNDSLTYNSFEKVSTVHEGNYHAIFTYNCNNQRAKMIVQQNGTPFFTRWYMGNSYMKQDSSGVQKEYTFIGGNAYTAPVVAITQGVTTKYYYLLRDYQGNIMSIFNQSYAKVKEYSYDAWGRMRNPADWSVYAPESEPWLFVGRGYSCHEHLPWFKLINMNGRLYDPLTAQFLSADNYIQSPSYTQNFNRYTYCYNNPLKYNDPTGLSTLMDPKLPGGDGGGGSDDGAKNFRFYEPVFDNGLGSGQAWICRTITPLITASKENRYYYVGDGKYQNCLGEIVSFEEVYANVLAPMFDHVLVRQDAYISTHPGEKGELKASRWVTRYEPIDYSISASGDGGDWFDKIQTGTTYGWGHSIQTEKYRLNDAQAEAILKARALGWDNAGTLMSIGGAGAGSGVTIGLAWSGAAISIPAGLFTTGLFLGGALYANSVELAHWDVYSKYVNSDGNGLYIIDRTITIINQGQSITNGATSIYLTNGDLFGTIRY